MIRRTLFVGASALVLLYGRVAWPQDDKGYETLLQLQARSLPEIRAAIVAVTDMTRLDRVEARAAPTRRLLS
jgi:hypothetical protein